MNDDLKKGHWIDAAWKKVLSDGADDAIDFFLPELAKDRDRSKEIDLAGAELPGQGHKFRLEGGVFDAVHTAERIQKVVGN
jgi:hypothetical protein